MNEQKIDEVLRDFGSFCLKNLSSLNWDYSNNRVELRRNLSTANMAVTIDMLLSAQKEAEKRLEKLEGE